MAIEDRNLTVGTRLAANYRRQAHACMVEKAEEGGGIRFVLEDGRKFKSPSSAASAVMGGKAVNGWRFWSVQGTKPQAQEGREKPETQASKPKRLVYRVPNQKGIAEGQSRWFCRACMKGFVEDGDGQPEVCRKATVASRSGRRQWAQRRKQARRRGRCPGRGPSGGLVL